MITLLTQEEECDENYRKSCYIAYEKHAFNETVKVKTTFGNQLFSSNRFFLNPYFIFLHKFFQFLQKYDIKDVDYIYSYRCCLIEHYFNK